MRDATEKDLGSIFQSAGTGTSTNPLAVGLNDRGQPAYMTGALSPIPLYPEGMMRDEEIFKTAVGEQVYEFLLHRYKWENLPEGLNHIRLEAKLLTKGQCAFIKHFGIYYAAVFNIDSKIINMYGEPKAVRIVEPLKEEINGLLFNIESGKDDVVWMRNNNRKTSLLERIPRLINHLEETLWQIDKFKRNSQPKYILNGKLRSADNNNISPLLSELEWAVNSEESVLIMPNDQVIDFRDMGSKNKFFEIMQTDLSRLETLINQYNFYMEQIKQLVGASINQSNWKSGRLISNEVNNQQDLPNATLYDGLKCRQIAVEEINKKFGLNIKVSINDMAELGEDEDYVEKEGGANVLKE